MTGLLSKITIGLVILATRLVTGVQTIWKGCGPDQVQRIYFANHSSHGDFVLIWTVLPPQLQARTRPVAAADYWLKGFARRFLAKNVFRAVLIERSKASKPGNPLFEMCKTIENGDSLIIFPEGTRNTTSKGLLEFKTGIYILARKYKNVEFVPVWLANLNRVLPKGEFVPVPLLCSVTFGEPLKFERGETSKQFLGRATTALLNSAPANVHSIKAVS